jgi:hypothetical protein
MANYSIPNSTPATGRTSTTSSRRSKKQNSVAEVFGLAKADSLRALRFFNVQRLTLTAQNSIQTVGRWMLDVGRSTFSSSRRVMGAWWPSRSSKPSSPRKWRDRFDSYPLRFNQLRIGDCGLENVTMTTQELRNRTFEFGIRVIAAVEALPKTEAAKILGRQLLRAGTSGGANYRAAARARSHSRLCFQAWRRGRGM